MRAAEDNRGLVLELVRRVATEKETLAEELGVSYASLYAWSTGRRRPGRRVLERMGQLAERRAGELLALATQFAEACGDLAADGPGTTPEGVDGGRRRAFDGSGGPR